MAHISVTSSRYVVRDAALRALLAAQGRRKDWLARQAGVHPSLLSHAMAGRKTLSRATAERMAVALQVPVCLLFDVSGDTQHVRDDDDGAATRP